MVPVVTREADPATGEKSDALEPESRIALPPVPENEAKLPFTELAGPVTSPVPPPETVAESALPASL